MFLISFYKIMEFLSCSFPVQKKETNKFKLAFYKSATESFERYACIACERLQLPKKVTKQVSFLLEF